MIIYGIIPIRTGMTAGTCYKIVVYLALQQPFVQIPVHIKEEISETFLVCMIQALHAGYAMG